MSIYKHSKNKIQTISSRFLSSRSATRPKISTAATGFFFTDAETDAFDTAAETELFSEARAAGRPAGAAAVRRGPLELDKVDEEGRDPFYYMLKKELRDVKIILYLGRRSLPRPLDNPNPSITTTTTIAAAICLKEKR